MLKRRHLATAATLLALQGCAAALSAKLPVPAAKPITAAKTGAGDVKPSTGPTSAAPTLAPLSLPVDISIKLPASLIDASAASVISNDGGSVISNDGGSVISNDGGSVISNDGGSLTGKTKYTVAAATPAPVGPGRDVAGFYHNVTQAYGVIIGVTNFLLSFPADPDYLALLTAGQRVRIPIPGLEANSPLYYAMELKRPAGQDPVLMAYFSPTGPDAPTKVLEMSFKDKDHGTIVFHGLPGMPKVAHRYSFFSSFDRVKNKAEVQFYFENFLGAGRLRTHLSVARPDHIVPGGPTLKVNVATAERQDIFNLPTGQVESTAYALADGTASIIFGIHPFDARDNGINFLPNPDPTASGGLGFFVDARGKLTTPTDALKAVVPPRTDVLQPFEQDPGIGDPSTDSMFQFKLPE